MEDVELKKLLSISQPKHFSAGESICIEGEPGNEMYLVLQGSVDIYISSMLEGNIHIAQVDSGGFFGEMAIFEQKPRSASCIAKENTVCIGVERDKLHHLIVYCPNIAEKMLEELSNRIRDMNKLVYNVKREEKVVEVLPFSIPDKHSSVDLKERSNPKYLSPLYAKCPVCQKQIKIHNIRTHELSDYKTLKNQRKIYRDFDALWHYIRICPECGYSNYYIEFFSLPEVSEDRIKAIIEEENQYIKEYNGLKTSFDRIAANYYRAIHFNRCLNGGDRVLLAKLWNYLYWLYLDAKNPDMVEYCRKNALDYYSAAYNDDLTLLDTDFSKQQCALIIGELYYEGQDYKKAVRYYHEVKNYANQELANAAQERIYELRALMEGISL